MRILGLDWGAVRIGVAISDPDGKIAFPLEKFIDNNSGTDEIKKIVDEYQVDKIIIGMPKSLSGAQTKSSEKVEAFVKELVGKVSCKIELVDERFSSVEAEKKLSEAGMNQEKQRIVKDNMAAQILLQSYLENQK